VTYRINGVKVTKEEFTAFRAGTEFVLPRVMISRDYETYNCPVTGRPIDGKREHLANLERTGCRILEPGEKEHNERTRKERAEQALEKQIDQIVNQTVGR